MFKSIFIIFISFIFLIFSYPVYSFEVSPQSAEKYVNKISNKFSRTYCNTIQFGISNEGALEFAIGETLKEFKNNKLNQLIDYPTLEINIVNLIEKNCEIYDFPADSLKILKFNNK